MNKNWNLEEIMLNNVGDIQSKIFQIINTQWSLNFSARYTDCTARQYNLVTDSRKICAIFNGLQWSHLTDDLT